MLKNKNIFHSDRILQLRYKFSKLHRLLPSRQKNTLSCYEDIGLRNKFYSKLWRDSAESLNYSFEELGYGYWKISNSMGRFVRGNAASLEIDTALSLVVSGNKPLVHQLVSDTKGYRVADYCEFNLQSISKAKNFLLKVNQPCVIKPAQDTGAGSGVTMNIDSDRTLVKAAIHASGWSKKLLIEETIRGDSYRILVLNNQVISSVRRDPPRVMGDGKNTISELIKNENKRRMGPDGIVSLFPILIDMECKNTLRSQSYTLNTVLDAGKIIRVKNVVNQNAAEQNVDVSEMVHPEIIQTSIDASRKLGLHLAGVDVLTTDISLPLSETGGVINEINGSPGLHHHYLVSRPQETKITEAIIDYCINNSAH